MTPHAPTPEPRFRRAAREDVPDIVRMLADDPLGGTRESYVSPLPDAYYATFEAIGVDPNNELIVVELDGRVAGVLQLTYLPSLSHRGSWRAQIEGVRIDAAVRSAGLGRRLIVWAIDRARARGCRLVQLTTDKRRPDAIRFYESLGFSASHQGMKLPLDARSGAGGPA